MAKWINTIEDFLAEAYKFPALRELDGGMLLKADAPVLTTTTGARNIIYGRKLWAQVILNANQFGVLPKEPWQRSGYRAITAAASTAVAGVAEGGAIPDTIKPTFTEIDIKPKVCAANFDMSAVMMDLATKDDVVVQADLSEYMANEFKNRLNRNTLADNDTVQTTGLESVDRVIGSNAELAYGKVNDSAVLDAGDLDIYGIDRDAAASWADAYVSGLAYASGQRELALSHIDTVLQNIRPYWNDPGTNENKVIVTGYDTLARIMQLVKSQQRFVDTQRARITVNGIRTVAGTEVGLDVAAYNGIPVIPDANVLQDTISRIYVEDLDNLSFGVLRELTHVESDNYLALGKIATEAMDFLFGEVVCTKFKAQGKVRDLK
uniref:Putative capsid protein n=1 Tax=viral metagenome TaxID=1070528 RepID=A0A6M3XQX8_9ZZZZ